MKRQMVYMDSCKKGDIMILRVRDEWEVYYKKPQYAFRFAFGLMKKDCSLEEAFRRAKANFWDYDDLFY